MNRNDRLLSATGFLLAAALLAGGSLWCTNQPTWAGNLFRKKPAIPANSECPSEASGSIVLSDTAEGSLEQDALFCESLEAKQAKKTFREPKTVTVGIWAKRTFFRKATTTPKTALSQIDEQLNTVDRKSRRLIKKCIAEKLRVLEDNLKKKEATNPKNSNIKFEITFDSAILPSVGKNFFISSETDQPGISSAEYQAKLRQFCTVKAVKPVKSILNKKEAKEYQQALSEFIKELRSAP